MEIKPIAMFHSPFTEKFGIPKQSGLAKDLEGTIVFEEEYRNADALRGIEKFDYLWLIWEFSANRHAAASPVVRPPLLGGNTKMGVWATRSPFRPNAIGLSSVRLASVEWESAQGPVIHVTGADLMDGTPIYDIKPYVTYADSHAGARSGFVDEVSMQRLEVAPFPAAFQDVFTPQQLAALHDVLALDPRPHYQDDPFRVYGMTFAGVNVRFTVKEGVVEALLS